MAILRGIWGILVGALAAALLGTAFDLVRNVYRIPTESYWHIYTWVAGICGVVAGWIAISITGGWGLRTKASSQPTLSTKAGTKSSTGQASKPPAGFADVPGMPVFDYTKRTEPAKPADGKAASSQEKQS